MDAKPEDLAGTLRPPLKIVLVGHVDHGKSTLVGRLLHDTGSLPEGKIEAIRAMCERRAMPFEWACVMDAFQAERDQAAQEGAPRFWLQVLLAQENPAAPRLQGRRDHALERCGRLGPVGDQQDRRARQPHVPIRPSCGLEASA